MRSPTTTACRLKKAISLFLKHGNIGTTGDETATNDEVLGLFEVVRDDDEERTAFYNQHQDQIHRAFETRNNKSKPHCTTTKTQSLNPKTPFLSAPLPWT